MNDIFLDSNVCTQDYIKYISLNIERNIECVISTKYELVEIIFHSCNGLFDSKTYYVNKNDMKINRDSELFMLCKCYIDLFIEWFDRKDVKVDYSVYDLNHFVKNILKKLK